VRKYFIYLLTISFLSLPGNRAFSGDHVHIMHLDGVRSDLLKSMLEADQLPFLKFLLKSGKMSYEMTTVDKSETMKVILSYLTSRFDTEVVGWWQFSRDAFQFRNFWLNPVEILNYALGLEFPLFPTVYDFLSYKGENVVSGFQLHRRGVPFNNYARAYFEGLKAVYDHTYFAQARATMDNTLDILKRTSLSHDEKIPALSTSLFACLDEFSHIDGVTQSAPGQGTGEFCFMRRDQNKPDEIEPVFTDDERDEWERQNELENGKLNEIFEPVFTAIERESERTFLLKYKLKAPYNKYFKKVKYDLLGNPVKACIKLPLLKVYEGEVHPAGSTSIGKASYKYSSFRPALAMIFYDMQLGKMIKTLMSIRLKGGGTYYEEPDTFIPEKETYQNSLFARTLFIIFGDHGFVDSKHRMARKNEEKPDILRHEDSLETSFIEYLNKAMKLKTPSKEKPLKAGEIIGIDDTMLPAELTSSHRFKSWQGEATKTITGRATAWAKNAFDNAKLILKEEYYEKYWWLFFLKKMLVVSQLNNKIDEKIAQKAIDVLAKLYLAGDEDYVKSENKFMRDFYDRHVRLVYGGGARNNSELFIPGRKDGKYTWERRPTLEEILSYAPEKGYSLMNALRVNPGTGIIFIRKDNEKISSGRELPSKMEILVMDRYNNRGIIAVSKSMTGDIKYSYRIDTEGGTGKDPLGYIKATNVKLLPQGGNYNDWNDFSILEHHYYHNAVAGIGSILYTNNPSVGDILVMHSQDWNFGGNAGGHGGIHRGEKITFMMVSGPGVHTEGSLFSKDKSTGTITHPTILDVIPTALNWLGYGEGALTEFARNGEFRAHLAKWIPAQKNDILKNYLDMKDFRDALKEAGLEDLEIEKFTRDIGSRLLNFMPAKVPKLPDFNKIKEDGNQLILGPVKAN